MSEQEETPLDDAARVFAKDVDLDVPLEDSQKQAIRWLLEVAFKEGVSYREKLMTES